MRSLELFSGAGGLALGLEAAEFEPVAFIEWDRDACETLRRNRPNWNVIEGDVSKIDFSQFSEVDLVAIATRGHSALHDFIDASTTEKVVRRSACNVLVVRTLIDR